ncbi:MAG: GntR family transcriptional regulator [Dongiaceae bacterium]
MNTGSQVIEATASAPAADEESGADSTRIAARIRSGNERLSTIVYEEVRNRICMLRYPPGHLIHENKLAQEFGISRTPVRQVLQKLEIEGFVETRSGIGTRVTGVNFAAFRDVYALRLKLAELIGELSPNVPTAAHVGAMQALFARAHQLRHTRDTEQFWQINHDRQGLIASLIGNSALRELYDSYYYRTARVWYEILAQLWDQQIDALCAELQDLIRAMQSGDPKAVAYVERNHLSYYMAMLGSADRRREPLEASLNRLDIR